MLSAEHNILHLIDTLWLGGAQRVVKGLFENNQDQKRLYLLALRETEDMITIAHPNVFIGRGIAKWDFRSPLKKALKLIKDNDIITLHCHLPKSQLTGYIIKQFYYPDIKLIFHEQGDIMDPLPYNFPGYLLSAKKTDIVICCSEAVKTILLKRTPLQKEKVVVIHNYVDTAAFNNQARSDLEKDKVFRIGFAGRLIKRKGWLDFLKAITLLTRENPSGNIEAHIAGTGPDEAALRMAIKQLKLQSHIILFGFEKNMSAFYSKLDLLCVSSHWEPVGMVHLEAMCCGIPVVASDVTGLNEILKHEENCLLFPPGNPAEIKNAMLRLMNDKPLYTKLQQRGRQSAHTYNYLHHEEKVNAVYSGLGV